VSDPLDLATHIFLPCEYLLVKNPTPRAKDGVSLGYRLKQPARGRVLGSGWGG
jgi:hypothetical protein